jgi:oxygen-independent coproporphyrinogen-3 oxidase
MEPYLNALCKEIAYAGDAAKAAGYSVETLYFGGGTPTSLSADQLDMLLTKVSDAFALGGVREYTVEAGRPDTITEEKLHVLFDHGVDRISINPQSMKQKTLDLIGRRHTVDDVYNAFELAGKTGIEVINADLIAGLPEEKIEDFQKSLEEIIHLGAGNITLHTLAVKRASKLKELDENFNYKDEELRERMLVWAHERLRDCGYRPYYLYRQKHTSGNTENTGFCKDDRPCLYNIRIMEEAQSNLALGAGGISKIYFPAENRLERVANVSNYEIYIDRIDDMIDRKKKGFF